MNNINLEVSTQDRTIDLRSIGGLLFEEHIHRYTNNENVIYPGVTTLLHRYEHLFDDNLGSTNSAIKEVIINKFGIEKFEILKKQCKEVGLNLLRKNDNITFEEKREIIPFIYGHDYLHLKFNSICNKFPDLKDLIINTKTRLLNEWKETSNEAIRIGSLEHNIREEDIKKNGFIFEGTHYKYVEGKNILNVTIDDVVVIPECLVWNHDRKLAGLADIFLFNKGTIYVLDYKTNEELEMESFRNKKMKGVCKRLMNCSYHIYSLQLRIYQEMAIRLRPEFKIGPNTIIHTAMAKYNRTEDKYIPCFDVENEIIAIFDEILTAA